MTVKQDVLDQLDELIAEGKRCDDSFQKDKWEGYESSTPETELRTFVAKAFAAIERIAGKKSKFYQLFPPNDPHNPIASGESIPTFIPAINGSLIALRDAVDKGFLESLEGRIRASIHVDFLQQAKDLLDSNYHIAAMVLIGGVLEDHLQKLCTKNGFTWNGNGSMSKYNDACYTGEVYNKAVMPQIQSIGALRNYAAHGKPEEMKKVKPEQVKDAHKYVGHFLAEHPA